MINYIIINREQELMDTIGITEDMSDEEKDEKYNNYMQEQYRQMEEVMGIEVNNITHSYININIVNIIIITIIA